MTPDQVLQAFDGIRRAQNDGRYAPHKPLLLMLALARVQQGEPRLVAFPDIESKLKTLLMEFGPIKSAERRHLPFWHLATDQGGSLWTVQGPPELLARPHGVTPTMGELRQEGVKAGFSAEVYQALARSPALVQEVAQRVLDVFFPATLHLDIAAEVGLDLMPDVAQRATQAKGQIRRRDPAFRERVLRAYEFRCCVCGFDLRVGHLPAGLEAAHIHWHTSGGPSIETNGLSLCALHHKLFDLGAFTVEPAQYRVVFSQHAISSGRGTTGVLAHHGQPLLAPQDASQWPGAPFLEWNRINVFKAPQRVLG